MYNNNGIFDEFKNAFRQPNNGLIKLILINISVFLILIILRIILLFGGAENIYAFITHQLMLPASLSSFITKPWTLVTYFFTHTGFFHILFNMLFLYWFGRIIVEFLGNDRAVNLYILGGLAGGVLYMLLYNLLPYFSNQVDTSVMLGASAGVFAIVVGAAVFMPDYTVALILIGPVKIKYIALFYVILSLAQATGSNAGGELAHLAGAGIGFIYIRQLRQGNDIGKPITRVLNYFENIFESKPKVRVSYKSKKKSGFSRTEGPKDPRNAQASSRQALKQEQEEIDAILDKISEKGYESLTKEEKEKLFNASKE